MNLLSKKSVVSALLAALTLGCSQQDRGSELLGANSVGNGGGVWVCWEDKSERHIRWSQLVDLYEAEREYQLELKEFSSSDYEEIVRQQRLRVFEASQAFYGKISPYLDTVLAEMQLVDSDLGEVDDANYRVVPALRECEGGYIARRPHQLANYTHDGRILINNYIWHSPLFSPRDRAALIFHEAVYAYLRAERRAETSDEARKLSGYIFADLSTVALKEHLGHSQSGPLPGVEMSFATIPAGSFMMGSPESENGRYTYEGPQRRVTISKGFEMQVTEVTQGQWYKVMGNNPSDFSEEKYCPREHVIINETSLCPTHPVEQVSWYDVRDFIFELNRMNDGYHYRLPTEAEWEYAARAGTVGPYSVEGSLDNFAWYHGNSNSQTHPVAQLKANGFGLYDVHGNVWEWTADWFDRNYYSNSPSTDPTGPYTGSGRVVRGGSWDYGVLNVRSALRYGIRADYRYAYLGLRLLRTPK